MPLQPSMVVESGGGLHTYWDLAQPFYLKKEMAEAKRWLSHIASTVADVVDESVSEPARVLRIPGSYNFKKEYDEPRPVTLSHHSDVVYTLDQIRDAFGEPSEQAESSQFAVPETVSQGDRHYVLYKFLRSQKARKASLPVALAGCYALNVEQCDPPLPKKELQDYLTRVWEQPDGPGFDAKKKDDFARDKKTKRINPRNQDNVRLAFKQLKVEFRYDTFNKKTCVTYPDRGYVDHIYEDRERNIVWLDIDQTFRLQVPDVFYDRVVAALADDHAFNPVLEYLEGLEWDRVERIDEWLIAYAGADDVPEYTRAICRLFLLGAVARIYVPGCKFDEMVVLESQQGTGKSTLLRTLCPNPDWFSDDLPLNVDAKQIIESTGGKWIIEASELSGMHASKVEHLKSLMSRQVDGPARMAYAHLPIHEPRRFVLVGTTNAHAYLDDATGNRRFWPIHIGTVRLTDLACDKDQLWAEAVHVLKTRMTHVGDRWELGNGAIRLDPSLYAVAAQQQQQRRTEDPWESILADAFEDEDLTVTTQDVFTVLDVKPGNQRGGDAKRVSKVMQTLGFVRQQIRGGGNTNQRGYMRGTGSFQFNADEYLEDRSRRRGNDNETSVDF